LENAENVPQPAGKQQYIQKCDGRRLIAQP
jgi:hypothetical protein